MKILAHTCFIGDTGYANHARSFFTALNKHHEVKVRNCTVGKSWSGFNDTPHDGESYLTDEMKQMLCLQTLNNSDGTKSDYPIYQHDNLENIDVHIVLVDMNHQYFYDNYKGYKVAYNVWETTRYPDDFFRKLMEFDEIWVPSNWQKECLIEQGCSNNKIKIVPEGVDADVFKPNNHEKNDKFRFLLFGRWEYRKSTAEIIKTFGETFKGLEDEVELICSVENPYPFDGLTSTKERIKFNGFNYENVRFINFPKRDEYVKYLQDGDVFVSCARSEGWNLPLCVPGNKKIISNENIISIKDVSINDFVISHTGIEQKVINVFKRKYTGVIKSIKIHNDYENLELTPEHPVYVIKRSRFITKQNKFKLIPQLKPEWIPAKDIIKGDIIIRTTPQQKYSENEIIDLLDIDKTLLYDEKHVWYKTGYNNKSEQIKYKRFIKLWDLSYIFGWYIAEGCDGKSKLIFSLNALKEVSVAEKIISEIFKIFGSHGTYKIKDNKLNVVFNSVLLCKFFTKFCGSLAQNKFIPNKILFGPISELKTLVDNMFLGDGCEYMNHLNNYTTISYTLARQLIIANQRLNIKTTIQISKRLHRETNETYVCCWCNENKNHRHSNKSWWHPEGLCLLVKDTSDINYDNHVYNLEVENDNSYLLVNATVHNCEAMACGTPSIYSNWGGQLEFANGKGIPIKIKGLKPANIGGLNFPGDYCEPDFDDLALKMLELYENYTTHKINAIIDSDKIHEEYSWDKAAEIASNILTKTETPFVFVATGNESYMSVIEQMVKSLLEFSKAKILVYGVDCEVPFDYPNVIKRTINPPKRSEHDKWYWKQYACIESLNENFENYVWIDGDVVANYNIDNIKKHFNRITNYPISDIHIQEMYYGTNEYGGQWFNQHLCELFNVQVKQPLMHVCLYVYNKECKWWFEEIIKEYNSIPLSEYKKYLLWNDEGLDNVLRWKYNCMEHLPFSNFDTSSYNNESHSDTNETMQQFYTFWNVDGPYNFNNIYGFQYFPKDKSDIIYFHGNKNADNSNKMLQFIKLKKEESFFKSEYFYTSIYNVKNLGEIKNIPGGTYEIAQKYGWDYAIYHEIYNLQDYYNNRDKKINDGDIVVDLGGNIGIFNRWAYSQGAAKVISFEPDKRYFKLLSLNSDPRSILFNAAVSDKMGELDIYESEHLGGSSLTEFGDYINKYKTRTYTLDYLFNIGLIDHIDFLKIDIEGSEINALKGISDENLKKVKTIAMEYHHGQLNFDINIRNEFINRLNNNGFKSYLLFLGRDENLQMIYFTK